MKVSGMEKTDGKMIRIILGCDKYKYPKIIHKRVKFKEMIFNHGESRWPDLMSAFT